MTLGELKQVMLATAGETGAFPDLQATIDEMIAEGEKVMVRWTQSATHIGEFVGIPSTGKRLTWSGINIFRVVDGKIAEDTPYWVFSAILRQLHDQGVFTNPCRAHYSWGMTRRGLTDARWERPPGKGASPGARRHPVDRPRWGATCPTATARGIRWRPASTAGGLSTGFRLRA